MTNPTIQPKKPRPGATDWEPHGTHGTAERWVSGGLWRHVNDAEHHVCPCQETEPAIETVIRGDDPDLFVWRVAP